MRTASRLGGSVAALLVVAGGGVWMGRGPIADHFIAQAFKDKGIAASYRITRIGPRSQRIEQLVIGDPHHPDLRARVLEVDLGYHLFGVQIIAVRADGVVLNARYHDGRLSLGTIDRLLENGGSDAVNLPNIQAEIKDMHVNLASDYGAVTADVHGSGLLSNGFAGQLHVRSARLSQSGCMLDQLDAPLQISSESGRIRFKGPLGSRSISCAARRMAVDAPTLNMDVNADPALAHIDGASSLTARGLRLHGRQLDRLAGLVTLTGSAKDLRGSASISAERSNLGQATTGAIKLGGNFGLWPRARDRGFSYSGVLSVERIKSGGQDWLGPYAAKLMGTPLAPIAHALADALRSAQRANRLTMSGRITGIGSKMALQVNDLQFAASSGARIASEKGSLLTVDLPGARWRVDGGMTMAGGGLPTASLSLSSAADGRLAGRLAMQPFGAGGGRLVTSPILFQRATNGAMRLQSLVTLDGPLPDGAIKGAQIPLDLTVAPSGAVQLAQSCLALGWQSLRFGNLALEPAHFTLCGVESQILRVDHAMLKGRIGESALALTMGAMRYRRDKNRFALSDMEARLGSGADPVRLTARALDGGLSNGALSGMLSGANAIIGPVPLALSEIGGRWRLERGELTLEGQLRADDRQIDKRFNPLVSEDFKLRLANGRIDATGTLKVPDGRAPIAALNITHGLSTGLGQARFIVDKLRFEKSDPKTQPEAILPVAKGVIGDVEGVLNGQGQISWSTAGVTSSDGLFSTRGMNFAAAFGPVKDFATTIHFTDLLALKTAPHQQATLKQVSAGVDVFDGVIDYALLSSTDAQIEGGKWPFAGGVLQLLPARLNLDSRQPRHLSFRVVGIDAGGFINQMDLKNISATGTFDGLFPMVFDARGGRIENGLLIARPIGAPPLVLSETTGGQLPVCSAQAQAGTLSYVGPVSNAELGFMGKLAFNVLKHMGFKCLALGLDGSLDGEFVTHIAISGVDLGSRESRGNWLTRPFAKLPFRFNVRIEAPFRRLFNIASGISDPRAMVRDELNRQKAEALNKALVVQPLDSDKAAERKK